MPNKRNMCKKEFLLEKVGMRKNIYRPMPAHLNTSVWGRCLISNPSDPEQKSSIGFNNSSRVFAAILWILTESRTD